MRRRAGSARVGALLRGQPCVAARRKLRARAALELGVGGARALSAADARRAARVPQAVGLAPDRVGEMPVVGRLRRARARAVQEARVGRADASVRARRVAAIVPQAVPAATLAALAKGRRPIARCPEQQQEQAHVWQPRLHRRARDPSKNSSKPWSAVANVCMPPPGKERFPLSPSCAVAITSGTARYIQLISRQPQFGNENSPQPQIGPFPMRRRTISYTNDKLTESELDANQPGRNAMRTIEGTQVFA